MTSTRSTAATCRWTCAFPGHGPGGDLRHQPARGWRCRGAGTRRRPPGRAGVRLVERLFARRVRASAVKRLAGLSWQPGCTARSLRGRSARPTSPNRPQRPRWFGDGGTQLVAARAAARRYGGRRAVRGRPRGHRDPALPLPQTGRRRSCRFTSAARPLFLVASRRMAATSAGWNSGCIRIRRVERRHALLNPSAIAFTGASKPTSTPPTSGPVEHWDAFCRLRDEWDRTDPAERIPRVVLSSGPAAGDVMTLRRRRQELARTCAGAAVGPRSARRAVVLDGYGTPCFVRRRWSIPPPKRSWPTSLPSRATRRSPCGPSVPCTRRRRCRTRTASVSCSTIRPGADRRHCRDGPADTHAAPRAGRPRAGVAGERHDRRADHSRRGEHGDARWLDPPRCAQRLRRRRDDGPRRRHHRGLRPRAGLVSRAGRIAGTAGNSLDGDTALRTALPPAVAVLRPERRRGVRRLRRPSTRARVRQHAVLPGDRSGGDPRDRFRGRRDVGFGKRRVHTAPPAAAAAPAWLETPLVRRLEWPSRRRWPGWSRGTAALQRAVTRRLVGTRQARTGRSYEVLAFQDRGKGCRSGSGDPAGHGTGCAL